MEVRRIGGIGSWLLLVASAALLCCCLGGLSGACQGQLTQGTAGGGKMVWTNDSGPAARPATPSKQELFYWSNVEHRWKLLRGIPASAVRTAREALAEVNSKLAAHEQAAGRAEAATSQAIEKYIGEAAARHHVDPNLIRALIKVESNYNPSAVSRKGAMGLMQLMPETARHYDVDNPFDPRQNVDAGVRHLKGLLENFNGNVPLSLAAYNAGQGAVERSRGIPPYSETRNYVKKITALMTGGSLEPQTSRLSHPIDVHRDENGKLKISNWD
jgi:hypothetical protein